MITIFDNSTSHPLYRFMTVQCRRVVVGQRQYSIYVELQYFGISFDLHFLPCLKIWFIKFPLFKLKPTFCKMNRSVITVDFCLLGLGGGDQ